MKVKVKGLVFVGFAAMIFAANAALADNENTVTSKSYTEATYQHKSTAASIGNSEGSWTNLTQSVTSSSDHTTAPTAKAVYDAIGTAVQAIENGAVYQAKSTEADENKVANGNGGWKALNTDIATTTDTGNGATTAAIKTYVAKQLAGDPTVPGSGYQNESTENYQVGNDQGGWTALGTAFSDGAYTTKTVNSTTGIVTIDANATTDGTLPVADADKLPTASAVKTYVDNKATSDLSGKQDKTGANSGYKVGNSDGAWADMGSAVTAATDGYVSVTGGTDGAAVAINIDNSKIDTIVTSNSNNLVTSDAVADAIADVQTTAGNTYQIKSSAPSIGGNNGTWVAVDTTVSSTGTSVPTTTAVYNAIQNATGSLTIPAQNSSVCTATTPCALVDEAGALHWRTMATADHDGGQCGDSTGNCQ